MEGDKDACYIKIGKGNFMKIPMKQVFQVLRGLVSYIQKFYRKKIK